MLNLSLEKKILEIKKIVNNLLLSKKEKIQKIKKLISIPQKDVYKPVKILMFLMIIMLNTKVMVKKINQLKSILIRLENI